MYDLVKVWEAPYTGTISINGNAVLLNQPTNSVDGVSFSIEKGIVTSASPTPVNNQLNTVFAGYPVTLSSINTTNTIILSNIPVLKGQRIYFRVNSNLKLFFI